MQFENTQNLVIPAKKAEKGRTSLSYGVVKNLIFGLVGVSIVIGTFALEAKVFAEADVADDQKNSSMNYEVDNVFPDNYIFRFDSESSPRMTDLGAGIYRLEQGKMWVNSSLSPDNINILIGNVVIIPRFANFSLNFDGTKADLSVFGGDIYLGFLEKDLSIENAVDPYSPLFINRLLVPNGNKASISLNKVSDRLASLLPSKLSKEFKITAATEDDFAKENLNADAKFLESSRQNFLSLRRYKGATVDDGLIANFVFWAEENLAFIPEKKNQINYDHLFGYLDTAIFYATHGDQAEVQANLDNFRQYLFTVSTDGSEVYKKAYDSYFKSSLMFGPEDPQTEVFDALFANDSGEAVLEGKWLEIYKALSVNPQAAETALDNYFKSLDKIFGSYGDGVKYLQFLSFQSQLFDSLIKTNPNFYQDAYFAMKDALEQEMLKQYSDGQLKTEVSQDLVSDKIEFIKRLQKFFFEEKIGVDEGREILSRLIREIDDLMPAGSGGVAVITLFESQLNDIDDFWGYLNSPEYNSSKTYGLTHAERYKSYLEERDKIWSFINIREDVLGEQVATDMTVEDIVASVKEAFAVYPEYGDVQIAEIKDLSQRYVDISAVVGGYTFKAKYDRDNQTVGDIYAYDKLISDRPIKLDAVLPILQVNFAKLSESGNLPTDEVNEDTNAERTLKRYLANLAVEVGFVAGEGNVMIVDKDKAVYRFDGVYLPEYKDVIVSFDYEANKEKNSNVFIKFGGEPLLLDGEFTFEELRDVVLAKAKIEKSGKILR